MRVIDAVRNSAVLQSTKRSRKLPASNSGIPFNNRYFLSYVWSTSNICNPITIAKSTSIVRNSRKSISSSSTSIYKIFTDSCCMRGATFVATIDISCTCSNTERTDINTVATPIRSSRTHISMSVSYI